MINNDGGALKPIHAPQLDSYHRLAKRIEPQRRQAPCELNASPHASSTETYPTVGAVNYQ